MDETLPGLNFARKVSEIRESGGLSTQRIATKNAAKVWR